MSCFIDAAGREWTFRFDAVTRERVMGATRYDVAIITQKNLHKLQDKATFLNVMFNALLTQAEAYFVDEEAFCRMLVAAPQTIDEATTAMMRAIADQEPDEHRHAKLYDLIETSIGD